MRADAASAPRETPARRARRTSRRPVSQNSTANGVVSTHVEVDVDLGESTNRTEARQVVEDLPHFPSTGVNGHRSKSSGIPRKEVIQPQLPLRLPCYDFTPIIDPTFDGCLPCGLAHRLRVLPTFVV